MLRYAIGLVALLTIFSSCETDFKLTGDYQEKALVYGLLDPSDNPNIGGEGHLIRIQKAFLGEESAFVMALNADSSYFKYENLFVELIEYDEDGDETNRWALDTVSIGNKETGNPDDSEIDFFGPTQRLYKTETEVGSSQVNIDAEKEYEITLKKRPVGMTVDMTIANMDTVTPIADAVTVLVDPTSFRWNTPSQVSHDNGTAQKMDLFNTSGQFKDYTIRFDVADNARQYEVWLRFYYREVVGGVETEKSMEWRVSTFELEPGASSWQVQLPSEGIYSRIGSELTVDPSIIRYIGLKTGSPNNEVPSGNFSHDFDFFVRFAGDELYEYININNPSNSGALQDKPVYTNVNNGLGVFSSRSETEFRGLYLSPSAEQELVDGQYTQGLNFTDDD